MFIYVGILQALKASRQETITCFSTGYPQEKKGPAPV
jgi:hypothetical protein